MSSDEDIYDERVNVEHYSFGSVQHCFWAFNITVNLVLNEVPATQALE